jgi:hypothetical protein
MVRTRYGRNVKKPVLFEPAETVFDDDYCTDEHDTDIDSNISTEDEYASENDESSDEDDEDCDENGNLKDFVVDDDEVTDSDEESE